MVDVKDNKSEGTKKKCDWGSIICFILVVGIVFLFVARGMKNSKDRENCEEFFVDYDNATTLVEVKYGNSSTFGTYRAVGFIDDNTYMQYLNGEYSGSTIQIFHPYVKGNSTIINTDLVIHLKEHTYSSFYDKYGLNSIFLK